MKNVTSRGEERLVAGMWWHDRRQPRAQKHPEPGQQASEVVTGGGEHGVDGVSFGALEIIAVHAVVRFGVADHRLDCRAPSQITLDGVGDSALLARDVNPEPVFRWSIVAAISLVGDEASDGRADLALDVRDDLFQRVAIVGIARKRLRGLPPPRAAWR